MWQHMNSFAQQLLRREYRVRFLISSGYRWMNSGNDTISNYISESTNFISILSDILAYLFFKKRQYRFLFLEKPPSALLLVSWHPLNFMIIRLVKSLYPDTQIISWLHEPYKDEKKVYGVKAIVIYLIEFIQTISLPYIDIVIMHSHRAFHLFKRRYPKFKGLTKMVPLHFQDDLDTTTYHRRYISFLGRADKAKGIEKFFAVVEASAQNDQEWEYQIVTASNIQRYLEALSPAARQRLRVVNKPQISDRDLREASAKSLAVMALYKETMQSGIIPVAWMKGTPVIGTDIEGITEWIKAGITGVIVPANPTIDEIKAAIRYIKKHFQEMTTQCRADYLATFDDGTWQKEYGWILDLLPPQRGPALRL
jgi:glycosyltransferase involved in cell wall biosynthesis